MGSIRSAADLYRGEPVALLTKHGKERVIGPVLDTALDCRVQLVSGFDTDQFGSFTRNIARTGTQLEAARKKARMGMKLSGLAYGLASEGAFGPDPMVGMFPWNVELLIFIDDKHELELTGVAQGRANHAHLLTNDWLAAEAFAREAAFPEHHLVIRPDSAHDARVRSGIATMEDLDAAFVWAQAQSANRQVFLESDLRADHNPTRMQMIRLAAEDLAAKLNSPCPACGTPGFWAVSFVSGLPCGDCGAPTGEIISEIHGCVKCDHRETHPRGGPPCADPARCDSCNP